MTNIIETVVKAETKAIRALDKAQGSVMDNLRQLVEHEQFSVAMVGSYLEAFTEAMVAIGYSKNDSSFKVMKSQRKKVLTFCAGGLDQQGDWTLEALESECERIMHEPNLAKAYKAVSESIKDAKDEPESEGSEGEGGEGSAETISEAKQALIRHAIDLIAAMPENKTDDAHDRLTALFATYEA
jgi:hypothetical protein